MGIKVVRCRHVTTFDVPLWPWFMHCTHVQAFELYRPILNWPILNSNVDILPVYTETIFFLSEFSKFLFIFLSIGWLLLWRFIKQWATTWKKYEKEDLLVEASWLMWTPYFFFGKGWCNFPLRWYVCYILWLRYSKWGPSGDCRWSAQVVHPERASVVGLLHRRRIHRQPIHVPPVSHQLRRPTLEGKIY